MAGKRVPFGGMKIKASAELAAVCGVKEGTLMVPSEMNKKIWAHIEAHKLKVKKD